ncbi:unnamed protein product [Scytosiphon promiscuus]
MMEDTDCCADGDPPILAKFCPKDEYLTTFDMLQDECRNQAYEKAIRLLAAKPVENHDHPGNTAQAIRWLDIGTGSGLLASLVAAATAPASIAEAVSATPMAPAVTTRTTPKPPERGAQQPTAQATSIPPSVFATRKTEVYACEVMEEVADVASETFAKNGGRVKLYRGRSTDMKVGRDLPSRVPRVVSELLGTGLLEEGVLPTLRDAKARLLSPGFVSIPHSAEVWAFCCESPELHRMSRLLPSTADGGGGSGESFRTPSSEGWACCPGTAGPVDMHETGSQIRPLSPSVRIFDFDFSSQGGALPGPEGRKRHVRFPIDASLGGGGAVHAIVCWWRCFMDEGRTIVLSTSPRRARTAPRKEEPREKRGGVDSSASASPPSRDHWRQSIYLLRRPVVVGVEGGAVCATACHDDSSVWFDGSPSSERREGGVPRTVAGLAVPRPARPALQASGGGIDHLQKAHSGATASGGHVRDGSPCSTEMASEESAAGSSPPVCVCGLHRTCSPFRIGMLNDRGRTAAFRSTIRAIIRGSHGHHTTNGTEKQQDCRVATAADPGVKRRRATAAARVACVSDGFLLPLLSAQEGASEVLEIQPSAAYRAVCRDGRTIRPFPGGVSSVYDLLTPPPGSATAAGSGASPGVAGNKLDAVIGEPFFADLSTAAWPLEPLLLFWCARTALEARGCFSPRTRVVPARARLLACPFACDLLFRGRRPVGSVEGVDMSAVNGGLGLGIDCSGESDGGRRGAGEDGRGLGGEGEGRRRPGEVESVRLSKFGHQLLGPAAVVLDMDLTRPLCDLRGSRTEIRCSGRKDRPTSIKVAASAGVECGQRGGRDGRVPCHGVALWLDIWLDEEGIHRISTGPEKRDWPQGVLFFNEEWLLPTGGRSFHLQAGLQDGALGVELS